MLFNNCYSRAKVHLREHESAGTRSYNVQARLQRSWQAQYTMSTSPSSASSCPHAPYLTGWTGA